MTLKQAVERSIRQACDRHGLICKAPLVEDIIKGTVRALQDYSVADFEKPADTGGPLEPSSADGAILFAGERAGLVDTP